MQDRTLYGVEQDEGAIKSISENVISYEIGLNLIPFGGRWSMNVYHLMDKGQRSMSELVVLSINIRVSGLRLNWNCRFGREAKDNINLKSTLQLTCSGQSISFHLHLSNGLTQEDMKIMDPTKACDKESNFLKASSSTMIDELT